MQFLKSLSKEIVGRGNHSWLGGCQVNSVTAQTGSQLEMVQFQ